MRGKEKHINTLQLHSSPFRSYYREGINITSMSSMLVTALVLCHLHLRLGQYKHYISISKELNNLPKVIYLVSDRGGN